MQTYRSFTPRQTPQSEPIPGREAAMARNNAGGYGFAVDDWTRLDRFLVLGAEGGTYYVSERELTKQNATAVLRCLAADGHRTVARIVEISEAGRAPKNDPALFALALALSHGDATTRHQAGLALPQVARTGTHFLHFLAYVDGLRGWGRVLRDAVARWYLEREPAALAYQLLKYQSRDGWSHRDVLRLAHGRWRLHRLDLPASDPRHALIHWAVKGWPEVGEEPHPEPLLRTIWAAERLKALGTSAGELREACQLVHDFTVPREAIPSSLLGTREVWATLLPDLPVTALVRNLATLTRHGLLAPGGDGLRHVRAVLGDEARLRKARLHPIAVLAALLTYRAGKGARGQHTWEPVASVVDALDAAFYTTFGQVEPTGKRWLLALDVSGSMAGGEVAGVPGLTPRVASAALAMLTARVEAEHEFVAFTRTTSGYGGRWGGGTPGISTLPVSPRQRLDDVLKLVSELPYGGTDCALPMIWAREQKREVDVFCVLTDSETWAGDVHPTQALARYREATGRPARLIVVGMTASAYTIADPDDCGMLDVVGFDLATPELMSEFARAGFSDMSTVRLDQTRDGVSAVSGEGED